MFSKAQVFLFCTLFVFFTAFSVFAQLEYPGDVEFLGSEEIIFDWSVDSCEQIDIPDAPARAFRDIDGKIQLLAMHYTNYRMIGTSFSNLVRDCANGPVLNSDKDGNPASFNDHEWLMSTYTTDGKTIYAIIHNEYHAQDYPGQATCNSGDAGKCWYNALTFATSTDTGRSYVHAAAPGHLLAATPYQYSADAGPFGIFGGSNIVYNPNDGYYYNIIQAEAFDLQQVGVTVMRTQDLSDPASWRAWNGSGYTVQFINPYTETGFTPADHIVQPIGNGNIEKMQSSLTWSTYFDKWLLVGAAQKGGVWGFYYSISDDLINWATRKVIMIANVIINPNKDTNVDVLAYPSVIDHADTSRNFEISGQDAYLYFTRIHPGSLYDRDLVRVPIRFNKLLVGGFEVTGKGDLEDDNVGDGICETSAGNCSFRAANQESNARPNWYADSTLNITFNVAQTGSFNIKFTGAQQTFWYPVNINGYSQPGASANTNNFGDGLNTQIMVQINADGNPGLSFTADGNIIKGLSIRSTQGAALGFDFSDNNVVQGNFLQVKASGIETGNTGNSGVRLVSSSNNKVGGTTKADRNLIVGGVYIIGPDATNNDVQGNYIGTDYTGTTKLDTWGLGVEVSGDAQNNTIGGVSSTARNLISGANGNGIQIIDFASSGNLILNNFVGTDATGTLPLGSGLAGVKIMNGAEGNFIGQVGSGNVIADNNDAGIWIESSPRNFYLGNFIGTDTTGTIDIGNHAAGIIVFGETEESSIGGANNGEGNTIAFNESGGVALMGNVGAGIKIWSNAIYKNDNSSGIDLGSDGVTANDDGDADTGPNNWQNYPALTTAISGNLLISGTLNSTANTTFRIEFFVNDTCDASGYGEGQTYLDAIAIATDGNGDADFSVQLPHQIETGKFITATASAPDNSTSEFSNCVMAVPLAGVLAVTPQNLSTSVGIGESTTESLFISNTGTASVDWSLAKTAAWLTVSLTTGNIDPGVTDTVTITINTAAITEGAYTDTLTITANEESQEPIKVPLALSVTTAPNIVLSPTSFQETIPEGGQITKQLVIKNTGTGDLNYTVGWDFQSQWLSATNNSGTLTPGDSTFSQITANAANQSAGVYTGMLIINSNDADEPNINMPFEMTVTGSGPQIAVTPESIDATVNIGNNTNKQLQIQNVGNTNLSWSLTNQETWLTPNETSGNINAGGQFSLAVILVSDSLQTGTHHDTLVFSSNDADTPTLNLPVSFTIQQSDGPRITVSQDSLISTLDEGQSGTHSFNIGSGGDSELQWSISWQAAWLDVTPNAASTAPGNSEDITVTIDATGLSGGEWVDSLMINSSDPNSPIKKVRVYLTVNTNQPDIDVSRNHLVGSLTPGDSTEQIVVIANQGTGQLNWQIIKNSPWMSITPDSMVSAPGQSDSVRVMLYTTGLAPGDYSDTLLVHSDDPQEPEISIKVDLTVLFPTAVSDTPKPTSFALQQNYPNPFNPTTNIRYTLSKSASVYLIIYDIAGRKVREFVNERQPTGLYEITWNARDFSGKRVSSGMYFYKIQIKSNSESFVQTKKMLLLK